MQKSGSSISYQTERDKNEALNAYNNGTSKNLMDFHYRNTVGDKKALYRILGNNLAKNQGEKTWHQIAQDTKNRLTSQSKARETGVA